LSINHDLVYKDVFFFIFKRDRGYTPNEYGFRLFSVVDN